MRQFEGVIAVHRNGRSLAGMRQLKIIEHIHQPKCDKQFCPRRKASRVLFGLLGGFWLRYSIRSCL
jgi:hypothetical protein